MGKYVNVEIVKWFGFLIDFSSFFLKCVFFSFDSVQYSTCIRSHYERHTHFTFIRMKMSKHFSKHENNTNSHFICQSLHLQTKAS